MRISKHTLRSVTLPVAVLAVTVLATALLLNQSGRQAASSFIAPAQGEQYTRGQRLYNQHCASCHGLNGEGQFPDAPLKPDATGRYGAPPHNSTGHTWHHADQVLLDVTLNGLILEGFYPMPAFRDILTEAEVRDVLAYIKVWWIPRHLEIQATETAKQAAREAR